jgi:uncharacterized protein involved in tolerance to divalent cations
MKRPVKRVKAVMSMPGFRIEGYISVPEGVRASDFLNEQEHAFVSVVEARIYDWKGDFIEDKEFMAVNKERISWMAEI